MEKTWIFLPKYCTYASFNGLWVVYCTPLMKYSTMSQRVKSGSANLPRLGHDPHVLLLIDTAGAVGRGIVEGIGRYAAENGPWLIQYEYRALDSLPPKWLEQWQGDGIITRTIYAQQAKMIQTTRAPYVELFGHPKIGASQMLNDHSREGQMAVEHFLNCGLRHFAYFSYGDSWWIELHRECFCKDLKERGYDCHIYRAPSCRRMIPVWDERQLPRLMEWLRGLPRPIGIITPADLHAVCLLGICRELHIAVPEEMAILGRGNDPVICDTVRPTLSSMSLDARRMGYEAARMLDQKMAGNPEPEEVLVPPTHVAVRQSTDLMVIGDGDVVQALRFIRDNACKGIEVRRVADEVGLSRRVLERRFMKHLGRTPKAEIIRIQIERAKMLLAQTDGTLDHIAQKCGFTSPEYLSRAFRREVGITTKVYRRIGRVSRDSSD
jgi:LacI family transcriptional regulator